MVFSRQTVRGSLQLIVGPFLAKIDTFLQTPFVQCQLPLLVEFVNFGSQIVREPFLAWLNQIAFGLDVRLRITISAFAIYCRSEALEQ